MCLSICNSSYYRKSIHESIQKDFNIQNLSLKSEKKKKTKYGFTEMRSPQEEGNNIP